MPSRIAMLHRMNTCLRGDDSMASMCHDSRLYGKEISTEERIKHLAYIQVVLDGICWQYWGWNKEHWQ